MRYAVDRRQSRAFAKKLLIALAAFLVLLFGGYWMLTLHRSNVSRTSATVLAANDKTTGATYQKVTGKYLFSGTIMLGRAVETYAAGNYNQPFSGMGTFGAFDARIGVLECPVTSNNVSYQTEVDSLIFNCKPGWLPTLKKYFPIINVSSNHLYDQGASGFAETVSRLKGAGFQVVGNYNPHAEKDDCKPVILPVRLQKPNGQEISGSLPVAFCSYNYKELFSPAPGEIESIHKWSRLMPVIALMNGGPEYEHTASASQISNAHKMIDAGASFVVGNGTHWAQNTEVYKGKLIVYSLGNFIFDQLDTDGRLALNLSVAMNVPYDANVGKWLQMGNECKPEPGSCWGTAESEHLSKIAPNFTFDAIVSYGGYLKVTARANAQQQQYIEQRANLVQTQRLLTTQSEYIQSADRSWRFN